MTVSMIMTLSPTCVGAAERLSSVHAKMLELDIRHVPVVEDDRLIGIISDRDLLRLAEFDDRRAKIPPHLIAQDAMTQVILTCRRGTPVSVVAERMISLKIDCVPVTDEGGKIVGLLTSSDILRLVAEGRDHTGSRKSVAELGCRYAWDIPTLSVTD